MAQLPRGQGTVLVTGACGRLGKHVVRMLHRDRRVIAVDRRGFPDRPKDVVHEQVDLRRKKLKDLFRAEPIEAVVHLGVMHDPRVSQAEHHSWNVAGFQRLLEYVSQFGVPKLVVLSSANVYGPQPDNPQFLSEDAPLLGGARFSGISDLIEVDMLAQSFLWKHPETETVILRPVHIVGRVHNAASNFLRLKRIPTLLGYDPMVQVVHERDVVRAIQKGLQESKRGIYNIAGPEPLPLYRTLRRVNPAPFSAYLRVGEAAVLSSSPERFLSIGRDRWAEAKPIKGTVRRSSEPAEDVRLAEELRTDEKSRAENLMICDLLRNDLGVVSEIGTVHVPNLMHIESYETVHQLVSTVRGRLRPGLGATTAVRACFPPGSMTGAPKERTMAILDALEGEARGVYSGAIGYFGLGGGCDLSVAIRTVVLAAGRAAIGTGGAVVIGSEPEAEFEETLLKAWAPMRALDPTLPDDYRRITFSASSPRVTPRKSTTSGAASTTAA